MKTLKKTLCLILAVVMVVGVLILPAHAADDYTDAITTLQNYKVLQGKGDGKIHADDPVTRADMAAIVYRIMTGDTELPTVTDAKAAAKYGAYADKFKDLTANDQWAKGYIGFCANQGVLKGDEKGNVKPNEQIIGYEVQAMLLRALGYDRNNEYTGSNWEYKVLADATKTGISKGVSTDPANKTPRGAVAQLTYNAATQTSRVLPAVWPSIGYNPLGKTLIEIGSPSTTTTTDKWGVQSKVGNIVFTWINGGMPGTYPIANKVYAEFFTPKTECDIAHMMEANGYSFGSSKFIDLDSYTNGSDNMNLKDGNKAAKAQTRIEILDTTNTIGHQGRWTRVYKDRIVYVDTFLGKVTDISGALYDTAGHEISPATATITIYSNTYAKEGTAGTGAAATMGTVIVSNAAGKYAKNDMVNVQKIVTDTGNTLPTSRTDLKEEKIVVSAAKPVTVTVKAMLRDSANGYKNDLVGFVGTDGTSYLYNYTYGYNNGSDITRLTDKNIDSTYTVYVDDHNNVLGLVPGAANGGVGVVTGVKKVELDNGKFAIEYSILQANGSTTIRVMSSSTTTAAVESEISGLAAANTGVKNLVKFAADTANPGYYKVTKVDGNYNPVDTIQSGEANALIGTAFGGLVGNGPNDYAGGIVDDNTVFFVAEYSYKSSKSEYQATGYHIYKGFKSIPDLSFDGSSGITFDGEKVTAWHPHVEYTKKAADGTIDYVLVLYSNHQEVPKTYKDLPTFAYLPTKGLLSETGDDYRLYSSAVIDGVAGQTLQLTHGANAKNITNNGLYTFENKTVNGWDKVTWVSDFANSASNVTYAVKGGAWTYNEGVITTAATWSSGAWTDATNGVAYNADGVKDKYLTVADDVQVYVVNPVTGDSYKVSSDLETVEKTYGTNGRKCDIGYQFDENGYIDLIYVIDSYTSTTPVPPDPVYGAPVLTNAGRSVTANWKNTTTGAVSNVRVDIQYRAIGATNWTLLATGTAASPGPTGMTANTTGTLPEPGGVQSGWEVRAVLYVGGVAKAYSDTLTVY